jgi:hypothetical protein
MIKKWVRVNSGVRRRAATEMRIERANQEWKRPPAFWEEASLRWLIPRDKINNFTTDSVLMLNDRPAERAFWILSGRCQLRCFLPEETGVNILRTLKRGETFSGLLLPSTIVVAVEDGAMFCIRLRDMTEDVGQWAGWKIVLRQLGEIKALVQEKRNVL